MNLSTNLADPTFRGCKVFAQFPNNSVDASMAKKPRLDRKVSLHIFKLSCVVAYFYFKVCFLNYVLHRNI
jgi:hypothetical protein